METKTKNLFYITSYFHLLMAESIIQFKKLPEDSIFFVTSRGTKLPAKYADKLLYDGTLGHFMYRLKLYKKEKKRFKDFFKDSRVVSYNSFQLAFPDFWLYDEYHFFEEGLSAYGHNWVKRITLKNKVTTYAKFALVNLLFPFASKKIKGFILGNTFTSFRLKHKANLFANEKAFNFYDLNPNLTKVVTPIAKQDSKCGIKDSVILVCDCLSGTNKHLDAEKYLDILKDTLSSMDLKGKQMYVKLHPSDYRNDSVQNSIKAVIKAVIQNITPQFFNENLEEIAVSNQGNTFIGTSSTILFFAPVLGRTNYSISFARKLAINDPIFDRFLSLFGSTDHFVELFSQNVECL